MLTFNDVLADGGVDASAVRLVRHQVARRPSPYAVWKSGPNGPDRLAAYQAVQSNRRFEVGDFLASFVVTPPPRNETLFIGLFKVNGISDDRGTLTDPIYGHEFEGWQYEVAEDPRLSNYVGRLVVDWGAGARSWVQRAHKQPKPLIALRDDDEPAFPGFERFCMNLEEIPGMYQSWEAALSSVKGIYLLVDRDDGKQYVGSAKGEFSLFGRFREYAVTGHGGNVELRRRKGARYQVSVLQVVDIGLPDDRIERLEAAWKDKLITRKYGLNRN